MYRPALIFALAVILLAPRNLAASGNESPAISITSPDTATTFVYGVLKSHTLIWDKKKRELIAEVTFSDSELNFGQSNDDTHKFLLPGVTFDEAKGLFFAISSKGESIPIARMKKVLFVRTIETLPNAVVRVLHPKGNVSVILEAISPDDPAMSEVSPGAGSDVTGKVGGGR